jgi:hypothetical protein
MGLRSGGVEGSFFAADGALVAYDPSVRQPGAGACIVRREAFVQFLEENDLEVFWTILGEKMILGGGLGEPDPRRMEINGVLRLRQRKLVAAKPLVHYFSKAGKRTRVDCPRRLRGRRKAGGSL